MDLKASPTQSSSFLSCFILRRAAVDKVYDKALFLKLLKVNKSYRKLNLS